jgi:hypothetical protein
MDAASGYELEEEAAGRGLLPRLGLGWLLPAPPTRSGCSRPSASTLSTEDELKLGLGAASLPLSAPLRPSSVKGSSSRSNSDTH